MRSVSIRSMGVLLALSPTPLLAQQPNGAATAEAGTAHGVTQGFQKTKLGDFTIVALDDGIFNLATDKLLVDRKPGEVKAILAADGAPTVQPTSVNSYLIDMGGRRVLVDTGSGNYFGPTLGFALGRLKSAGYRPEDIDEVLITHLHPDHVGGLSADGKMVFPNATVRLVEAERAFWLDKANASKVDDSVKSSFDAASASLTPYVAAGRVKGFKAGAVLEPGITAVSLPGHTIGHAGYRVESKGETMLIWGDVMHVALVQLKDPAVTIRFDSSPSEAYASRVRIMTEASKRRYLVAGAHLKFPGIGRIEKVGADWKWVPIKE